MKNKKIKSFFANEKVKSISLILLEVIINGLILNFTAFSVFGLSFAWYSWLGWGFIPYVLSEMIPRIWVKFNQRL